MSEEPHVPNSSPSTQAARELAYRRWGPGSATWGASGPASAADSPASRLAHHPWGTEPKTAPPSAASSGLSDGANVAIALGLAVVAATIYQGRRQRADANRGNASPAGVAPHAQAAHAAPDAWRLWLAGGSLFAAVIILAASGSARRDWGSIAGAEALLLALVLPV